MFLSDFDYILPPELIAQTPLEKRDHSRLLLLKKETKSIWEIQFFDIVNQLGTNDILVVNQTRVMNARLKWVIEGTGTLSGVPVPSVQCEIFLHKKLRSHTWDCLVYPWKKLKIGTKVDFKWELQWEIIEISEHGRIVRFNQSDDTFLETISKIGETPLPPYIKEKSENPERYQTVYNATLGSVAAPTAGLHFTPELLEKLEKKWVQIEKVLLHVWIGTFKNVEVENIKEHSMHHEYCHISEETAMRLNKAKAEGKRIIAVGTTSVRTLESFTNDEWILGYGEKETNIFIYPWYTWRFVDSIITNFHLPKSTLLMLVSSFAGYDFTKKAYQHAVDQKFRFFSFWDAMWIQ
jgi:S-adenosylmethionine:tRNA ribosyltransferase-isomerase